MFIAPDEVPDQKLKRRFRGYSRDSVEQLLQNLVSSYEQVWRERNQLRARVTQLEKELAPLREAEDQLRAALVTAERAASEVRAQAALDADVLLEKARAKSKAEEKAVAELRAQAGLDAETLLEQARAKGKAQQSAAKAQQTRLKNEIDRLKAVEQELHADLRSFLRSGLQLVEDRNQTEQSPVAPLPPSTHKTPDPTELRPASA
jgi:cell division initiation protein